MVLVATQVKRRRGTTAENDAFTGAEGEITVDTEKHELRVHDGVTQGGFKIGGGSGAMPVGAIFITPRTGTIQGAVEANGNPYNIADYNGEGSIGALLTAGSIAYVSKAEFQTQVTNTGACDSFGWDGTSDTTFLVPKLNPWHVGKSAPVVGNSGDINYILQNNTEAPLISWANQYSNTNSAGFGNGATSVGKVKLTTDPTKSGMIADLSETTNLRVMVQLATGATDQALETCTSVLSDVSALNAHRVIEFQAPTADNAYTWYRKYADGWVEQGGVLSQTGEILSVSFPVEMADANYTLIRVQNQSNGIQSYYPGWTSGTESRTTTGFTYTALATSVWQVSGKSAQ